MLWFNAMVAGKQVDHSWTRVTGWLAGNAPSSYATLRPPAAAEEIASCERELGMPLPAGLRGVLLASNGAADLDADGAFCPGAAFLPGGHRLLSAPEIAAGNHILREILDNLDEEMDGIWWHPEWVLFARHASGDGLAIDQRPGPRQGAVGQFRNEDQTGFTMAPSVERFLGIMADALEQGTDFLHYRPFVKEERLSWKVVLHR